MDSETTTKWQSLLARLRTIAERYPRCVLASSLAAEDMVLTHALFTEAIPIGVFTLETGRLHDETRALLTTVASHYGRDLDVVRPEAVAVEQYVKQYGLNAFYESVDLRKACCQVRKVAPLQRVLSKQDAWVTGQRREQSITRDSLADEEFDTVFGLQKFNPLADWSHEQVWQVIRAFGIPYNPLHDRGYPSIGCEPCTRAIRPDEPLRAGRWWWESSDSKECGLHAGNTAQTLAIASLSS